MIITKLTLFSRRTLYI